VGSGALPQGHACDDFAAVHAVDGEVRDAVASMDGARAYSVRREGSAAVEEPLAVRPLG
jgi:hypothetical protein